MSLYSVNPLTLEHANREIAELLLLAETALQFEESVQSIAARRFVELARQVHRTRVMKTGTGEGMV